MTFVACNKSALHLVHVGTTKSLSSGINHTWKNFSRRKCNWRRAEDFKWFWPMQTRWKDIGLYGYVNSAEYLSILGAAIDIYLMGHCQVPREPDDRKHLQYLVHTECDFFKTISSPSLYVVGMSVSKLGNSSVNYKMGLFELVKSNDLGSLDFISGNFQTSELLSKLRRDSLCYGLFTHVYVDPTTEKPVDIEDNIRRGCEKILTSD